MRRLAATVALLFAALLAWVAAGPWLTMRAIGNAVRAEDHAALSRHIDSRRCAPVSRRSSASASCAAPASTARPACSAASAPRSPTDWRARWT